jgi:hypothetical protein
MNILDYPAVFYFMVVTKTKTVQIRKKRGFNSTKLFAETFNIHLSHRNPFNQFQVNLMRHKFVKLHKIFFYYMPVTKTIAVRT